MAEKEIERPNTEIACRVSNESRKAARRKRRENTLRALRDHVNCLTLGDNITFTQVEILLGDQVSLFIDMMKGTIMILAPDNDYCILNQLSPILGLCKKTVLPF